MPKPSKKKHRRDSYRFPGFYPGLTVSGVFGDPIARVIVLTRRSKKQNVAPAGTLRAAGTTAAVGAYAICLAAMRVFIWSLISVALPVNTATP